jgi:hypothetical protein
MFVDGIKLTCPGMVLFHCSFLALKAQEVSGRTSDLDDHILHGEIIVMSA